MDYTDWTTTGALGDRYVLRHRVGSGRATTVYVAEDVRLERQVALKVFDDLHDEDGYTRFATEAQVLAGMSHPGLVTVYDVNLTAERPYLVMRLVDGRPLGGVVDDGGLEPVAVAQLGAQLADALDYVHERGVVHGDVAAANVLVDAHGAGHLTGFGTDRGFGRPSGDIDALGRTLAACVPYDLGPEWDTVLGLMTDPDPDQRPDAARCGELLRNLASGGTADIPLPRAEATTTQHIAELPAKRSPARRRATYAGLAGMGLAVAALAVVAATASSGTGDEPSGEQQDRQVEEPTGEPQIKPPGQSYPQAPAQRPAPRPAKRAPGNATSTVTATQPAPPPPSDGPGAGNGNGNGRGKHKGLLGSILDGLG
jgi:serine/threonine protein kinase